jgi:OOP family OmpA-OmpF porin
VALVLAAGVATAQGKERRDGYLQTNPGVAPDDVVRAAGYGTCVRTGFWTPALAITACDPDLVPKPPAPKPPPPPPPPPPKKEEPPKPPPKKEEPPKKKEEVKPPKPPKPTPFETRVDVPFEFAKADITPDGRAAMDGLFKELKKGPVTVNVVIVTGHTDRIGSLAFNKKLSEARAQVVRDYLINTGGMDPKLIFWEGVGPRQPVNVTKFCDAKMRRKELIACLAPNRRTTVEVTGTRPPPPPKPAEKKM